MSVNLCIDWGNTNVKAAIFDNDVLKHQFTFGEDDALQQVTNILDTHKPAKAIVCSVVSHSHELEQMLQSRIKSVVKLDGNTRLPINNAYGSSETLGADRIALICGAHALYPQYNNLVICLGTCITYNLMQKNKTFRGGAISPGMHMRLRAMNEFTDKLPQVDMNRTELIFLGYDTPTCMLSGAVYGMAAEIDAMTEEYRRQYPDFNAILTGGDAPYFAAKLKSKIFADPDLLLKGLNLILNYNVPVPR
ncbi:MAG: putative transcriptional acitvator, Baf family [Flavipsychrobacter sp.]|nr:putative transcriptional acitvator, Baf family [Flavipsychrobacter sp.]